MTLQLTIVKDDRDHISKIVHEIIKVLNIYLGTGCVNVWGICDHDEFDMVTNNSLVLFIITDETKSLENRVPNWLSKLGRGVNSRYIVVREMQTCFEQRPITYPRTSYWTENEKDLSDNHTHDVNLIDVDKIIRVLKWWPNVIRRIFKTRKDNHKVNVVAVQRVFDNDNAITAATVAETFEDTRHFLETFHALAEQPLQSAVCKIFVVGDPNQFYADHKDLRQEKINGCRIILILVKERMISELLTISTKQMCLSNMISDVLDLMANIRILRQRDSFRKPKTINQVKNASVIQLNQQNVKLSWTFKSNDGVLSNPGNVSVQHKNKCGEKWKEIVSKEATYSTDEVVASMKVGENEFRIVFETATTGDLSSPISVSPMSVKKIKPSDKFPIHCEDVMGALVVIFFCFTVVNIVEFLAIGTICSPFAFIFDGPVFTIFLLSLVLLEKIAMTICIPLLFGPLYAIPTAANLIFPVAFYCYLCKDDLIKNVMFVVRYCKSTHCVEQ